MEQTLPEPSARIQELMASEQAKPQYQELDEDTRALESLKAIYLEHGESIFDFTNPTDDILRMTLTQES